MNEKFSLENKNILVTGSYGYLGKAVSLDLATSGAHVILNGRDFSKLEIQKNELLSLGLKATTAHFDICNEEQVKKYFEENNQLVLTGVVNNAYSGSGGTILSSTAQSYRDAYEISVIAPANLIKYSINNLEFSVRDFGYASIVNISSMYGLVSPRLTIYKNDKSTNPPFYGAAKAAMLQLTKYAAVELAEKRIRVNSVSPGPFPSPESQGDQSFIEDLKTFVPMNRIGESSELGGAVVFLLSAASSYVTGANISIDGGWTSW